MSGFKSLDHMRKMQELVKLGKISQAKYDEWLRNTGNIANLPQRVQPKVKQTRKYHK